MAGTICKVCTNANKVDIEGALLEGMSERNIAIKYGVNYGSVHLHKMDHMAADLLQAYKVQRRLTEVMDVPDKMYHEWEMLETLMSHVLEPLTRLPVQEALMLIDKQFLTSLLRLRHRYFVTMLQVLGEMPEQTVVNVMMSSQWRSVLQKVDEALGDDIELRVRLASILSPEPVRDITEYKLLPPPDDEHHNGNGKDGG